MQPPLIKKKTRKNRRKNLIIDLCFSETALMSRCVSDWEKQSLILSHIFPTLFFLTVASPSSLCQTQHHLCLFCFLTGLDTSRYLLTLFLHVTSYILPSFCLQLPKHQSTMWQASSLILQPPISQQALFSHLRSAPSQHGPCQNPVSFAFVSETSPILESLYMPGLCIGFENSPHILSSPQLLASNSPSIKREK